MTNNVFMRFGIFLLSFSFYLGLAGQDELRIGEWRSYLPAKRGLSVTQSPEAVFFGTEWALMRVDKEDLSLQHISKTNGLSDIGVQKLAYDAENDVLIVTYTNSNIDLVFSDEVVNLDQIKKNTQILQDRTINDIFVKSPYAYFATGYGITQLDLVNREFGFTTFTNFAVTSVAEFQGRLYASTETGLYAAPEAESANLADFGLWSLIGAEEGFPESYQSHDVSVVDDKMYVGIDGSIFGFDGSNFENLYTIATHRLAFTQSVSEGILTGWICNAGGCPDRKFLIAETGTTEQIRFGCANRVLDGVVDEQGRIWFADDGQGFHYSTALREPCQTITPDRPRTHNASQMATYNRKLYVASGGVTINYGYRFREDGLITNESGSWSAVNKFTDEVLETRNMRDFLAVEVADDGTVYVGTFWDGLIEYKDGVVKIFDKDNSSLQNSVINPDRNRITDLDFDLQGNLWITNHDSPRALSVKTPQGEWQSFDLPSSENVVAVAADHSGTIWIAISNEGLVLYNPGDDVLATGDDQARVLNANNSTLTSNIVNDIAVDKDGAVWVGTSMGPVVFDCGNQSFASNCLGIRLVVEQNSVGGELLGEEDVRAIAIDGGNRKWFGTTNGIFVQSADAETPVMRPLNEDNSPLFDNNIIDIEIDDIDGEVFIATDKGIMSLRSDAVAGGRFHEPELEIFPNPVRPGYAGPIAIKGLAENSNVKITDIQGKLVHESRAIGGQAIWYGEDLDGVRAASGVYLVFSTAVENLDSPDSAIGKIILVN